jgi:hypothetical protein
LDVFATEVSLCHQSIVRTTKQHDVLLGRTSTEPKCLDVMKLETTSRATTFTGWTYETALAFVAYIDATLRCVRNVSRVRLRNRSGGRGRSRRTARPIGLRVELLFAFGHEQHQCAFKEHFDVAVGQLIAKQILGFLQQISHALAGGKPNLVATFANRYSGFAIGRVQDRRSEQRVFARFRGSNDLRSREASRRHGSGLIQFTLSPRGACHECVGQ